MDVSRTSTASGLPDTTTLRVVAQRHPGRWVGAIVLLALVVWLAWSVGSNDQFDFAAVPDYLFDSVVLTGVRNTLLLTVVAMAIGVVLGVVTAVLRLSPNPLIASVSWFYVWFFRGTPVLVQLIFWFNLGVIFEHVSVTIPFGPTLWSSPTSSVITPLTATLLGLGLNEGAYMAEIVRGGVLAVDAGQMEAAQAIGMRRRAVMRHIVLPQAMRVIVPPTGNEFIGMLKFTSLASVISYNELLGSASRIYSTNLKVLELLVVASIWYLICTSVLSAGQFFLERKLAAGSGLASKPTLLEVFWRQFRSSGGPRPTRTVDEGRAR